MCGLAGAFGVDPREAREKLALALQRLRHRGPDDDGIEAGESWLLGFRRLSILDLESTGHQPITTPERDAFLVFNGEIYNFAELREELRQTGETCRSTGDAEVLLRLLRRHGRGALDRLNGMFALAFVDLRTRRFLLARDRLGVKPLYFARHGGSVTFASELPSLLALHRAPPNIDRLALNRYMAFGHIAPPLTIWEGIGKLPPGSFIEGDLNDPSTAKYQTWWRIGDRADDGRDEGGWLDRTDELLSDAVHRRLIADVPVGIFLSGGIDSGLVSYYAGQHAGSAPLVALTVDFHEREFSEGDAAAAAAAADGLEHRFVRVKVDSLASLPTIAWHCGEPFADASVVNQYMLARVAREHATVFLTGDGGDEAFGGYDEYVRMARFGRLASVAAVGGPALTAIGRRFLGRDSRILRRLLKLSGGVSGFGALVRQNFRDPAQADLLHPDWRVSGQRVEEDIWTAWEHTAGLPLVTRMQRLDYAHYLESDVLVKVDRATMAWSVEARSPFLDYRIVELAASMPAALHIADHRGKHLLRQLVARHRSVPVAPAQKRGFGLPITRWFKEGLAHRLEQLVAERSRPWWNREAIADLVGCHDRGCRDLHTVLWRVLMLEMWARVFLDGDQSDWVDDRRSTRDAVVN